MGAWGGWALAPNIAMGRDDRSHMKLVAERPPHVQKRPAFFLTFWVRAFATRSYFPADRLSSRESDFSEATVATGDSRARMAGNSFRSEPFSPVALLPLFVPLDSADTATGVVPSIAALTAAKASASPAPNRSSRPGEPRSRAVLVSIARSSGGFSAGESADIGGGERGAGRKMSTPVRRRRCRCRDWMPRTNGPAHRSR
jgi:hypothetical protein